MPSLLLDRYLLVNANQACDLATGDVVQIDSLSERPVARVPLAPALAEVLDHGREGAPRAIAAELRMAPGWKAAAARMASDAVDRGYVPIAAELYARVRPAVADALGDRTLLLLASDRDEAAGRRALLDAASRSSRPHVLVTLRVGREAVSQLREARSTYAASRPSLMPVVPADVRQQVQRAVRAEEFVRAGRHAAAERLLRDVAASLMRRKAWAQAVPLSIALGRLLLERGRALEAARVLSDAAGTAGTAGEDALEVEARIWLAAARTDAAQLTSAEAICRALLQVARLTDAHRVWVNATLIRVLLWQGRVHEALALPAIDALADTPLDLTVAAFIDATAVRLLLIAGRLFDAGVRAHRCVEAAGTTSPLARAIALTGQLRVRVVSGDLVGAYTTLQEIAVAAGRARAPFRLLRARLIWIDGIRRARGAHAVAPQWRVLRRAGRVAPPLLQHAIARASQAMETERCGQSSCQPGVVAPEPDQTAATLVRMAQDEEDEAAAIGRLLDTSARRLQATRIDVWSADAGPATVVRSTGTGLATTLGPRVIDAGMRIGPEAADSARQLGVPVRIGARLVAALVARWPADRVPPPDAIELLELVSAVTAPRIDAWLHRARAEAEAATLIPELVGVSRAMGDVRQAVARAAAAPFSVLVEGESGVGKELIARAVHYLSPRRERRFCDVNCAALPDELLESELFGHAKGAFTGAVVDRAGLFEDAHGGTLFMDEVADLSSRAQAKLLRVLQQQEIRRVGETFARPVDVRLVAAANRDMRGEAAAGRFRQDLLYRLDVIRINVPALRDRPEDIAILAQHFWHTAADRVGTLASLAPGVLSALAAYHWPGNVRELQNVTAALAVAAPRRGRVSADLLPSVITGSTPLRTTRLADAREEFERRFVAVAVAQASGNRARAARALGLSRQGLLKLMERLAVSPE